MTVLRFPADVAAGEVSWDPGEAGDWGHALAIMPALTTLTGLDEFGDEGPMPPAEFAKVRAMFPHLDLG